VIECSGCGKKFKSVADLEKHACPGK